MRLRAIYAVVLAAFVLMLSCATATCEVRCSLSALSGGCHASTPAKGASASMAMPAHSEATHCAGRHTSPDTPSLTSHVADLCLHHAAPPMLDDQNDQHQRLLVDRSIAPPPLAAFVLLVPATSIHAVPLARSAPPPFASSAVLRV